MVRFNERGITALVVMTAVLTACSASSNSEGDAASEEGQPVTVSFMVPLHQAETPHPRIEEILEEKLQASLEIQWIPSTTFEERLHAAFATGDLPDVAIYSLTGANRDAIKDGQYWEIGPYLEQYKNLSKLKDEILNNMKVDGKLYSLYQGRPLSRQGLIFRKDWADRLGLPAPTNTDELYTMLKQFTENDPDQNGQKDTMGLADRGDLAFGAFKTIASWFGTPNEWGLQDGKLMPAFTFPEYMSAMNYMKDLRDNGYINLDFPVTSKVDQQNLVKSGKAGAYIGCMCDVLPLNTDTVKSNAKAQFDVQNQIKGPGGEFTVWSTAGYNHPLLFPKSAIKTEEELKRILNVLDQMMSPEISNLLIWGIEGEHYTTKDGVAVPIADQAKIDKEVSPYKTLELGEVDTNGRLGGQSNYPVNNKADQLYLDNEKHVVADPTVNLDSATYSQEKDRLGQIIKDATYKYILGNLDEAAFQKEVERWKSEGGAKVIEEFNASYQQSKG
ncbi:hypothetical protein PM3016_3800 [Paenibacillus mucilaginosus 3016]|uniref:Family 1 extracellular solute-binding protein n=1 Tax=Paenibacillus mucilaginosus 3016 TaxID=1116391 RepID=H6NDA0_9BACL|nr:extracellular solute-binding protein [Paenibacillus mucilaginosus]AFC30613.1 hypothetical protein PM3016_3800 [Paenibacillus mucilaginosus 3016]WFA19228.1 extracellular solute-binding protein [Paenibacillus mucilaginosus]